MLTLNPFNEVISSIIDEYHSGFVTGIYGNAGSGKSTFCFLAALSAASKEKKVIYLDTEKSFNSDRISILAKTIGVKENFLDYIFLLQPKDFYEQHEFILKLQNLRSKKFFLLIIDSLTNLYRLELSKEPKKTNNIMGQQIQTLIRIARDNDKIVLITNQVKSDAKTKEIKMIANKMISNMCQTIIELNKIDDKKRLAKLIKHKLDEQKINKSISYIIKENGVFLENNF